MAVVVLCVDDMAVRARQGSRGGIDRRPAGELCAALRRNLPADRSRGGIYGGKTAALCGPSWTIYRSIRPERHVLVLRQAVGSRAVEFPKRRAGGRIECGQDRVSSVPERGNNQLISIVIERTVAPPVVVEAQSHVLGPNGRRRCAVVL